MSIHCAIGTPLISVSGVFLISHNCFFSASFSDKGVDNLTVDTLIFYD